MYRNLYDSCLLRHSDGMQHITQDKLLPWQAIGLPGMLEPVACCAADAGLAEASCPFTGDGLDDTALGWAAAPREAVGWEAAAAAAVAVSTGPCCGICCAAGPSSSRDSTILSEPT